MSGRRQKSTCVEISFQLYRRSADGRVWKGEGSKGTFQAIVRQRKTNSVWSKGEIKRKKRC